MRKKILKRSTAILVLIFLLFVIAIPAQAFESRSGNNVVIEEGEVVEDDLYVSGNTVEIRGTIKGDLVAVGSLIIIDKTGIVEGDLLAAGQGVVINGTVNDDVRIAGAVLSLGEGAKVGSDLLAFGYSLSVSEDADVSQDLIFYGGQGLLSGAIGRDAKIGTGGLKLDGKIGRNMEAEVGGAEDVPPFSPLAFMPQVPGMPQVPTIPGGFTIGKEAQIGGSLNYTGPKESDIPEGVVSGTVSYKPPPPPSVEGQAAKPIPTTGVKVFGWFLKFIRELVTLFLVGLILVYLTPKFLDEGATIIKSKPWHSILWGIVAYVAFFFAIFLLVFVIILVMVILGIVTLGGLAGTAFGVGVVSISSLTVAFHIAVSYLSKILVSYLIGRLIFSRASADRDVNRLIPLIVGLLIVVLLGSIPYLGTVINIIAVLLGLGALFLFGRQWWQTKKIEEMPSLAVAD